MAKIQEELIVIKLSKLHKDSNTQTPGLACLLYTSDAADDVAGV
jgi:hypothetical protein